MDDMLEQLQGLKDRIEVLEKTCSKDKLSILVFSGTLDKLLAAFIIATGAAAMGTEVSLFFTFWGTSVLRKKIRVKKDFISRMFGFLLPTGVDQLKLSRLNMAGAGTAIMKSQMKKKNIITLEEMLQLSEELDIRILICEMSMDLMGIKQEEIIEHRNIEYCGVARFLAEAHESRNSLFI